MITVSVLMSVYNDRGRLSRTIESVCAQTFQNFSFIIIDDGSNTQTKEILRNFCKKDARIVLLENESNLGLIRSLNRGLSNSICSHIARIDEGDLWDSKKLEKQIAYLLLHPGCLVLGTNAIYINSQGEKIGKSNLPCSYKNVRKSFLKSHNPIIHPSVIFKKNLFYNETAYCAEDYELWLRYFFLGEIENLTESLLQYVVCDASITNQKKTDMYYCHTQAFNQFFLSYLNKTKKFKFINGTLVYKKINRKVYNHVSAIATTKRQLSEDISFSKKQQIKIFLLLAFPIESLTLIGIRVFFLFLG